MVNNQEPQLATVSFTQTELKTIINVFNACPIKLGDSVLMIPIANKIIPLIEKEEVKETPTVESVSKN